MSLYISKRIIGHGGEAKEKPSKTKNTFYKPTTHPSPETFEIHRSPKVCFPSHLLRAAREQAIPQKPKFYQPMPPRSAACGASQNRTSQKTKAPKYPTGDGPGGLKDCFREGRKSDALVFLLDSISIPQLH